MDSAPQTALVLSHGIVQFDGASFPSLVLEGDAMVLLFAHVANNVQRLKELSADLGAALFHARFIEKMLLHYEDVSAQRGLALPYDIDLRRHASQRLVDASGDTRSA